jgi:glycosyltransferase involved in cell wall biosynthesis
VEAVAHGLPSVALRFGGYLDTIIDGVTGVYFDKPAPGDIATAVRTMLGLPWDVANRLILAPRSGVAPAPRTKDSFVDSSTAVRPR